MDVFDIIGPLFFSSFFILFFALWISGIAFWIWMLVDPLQRQYDKENDQPIWMLVIIFGGVIGAITY